MRTVAKLLGLALILIPHLVSAQANLIEERIAMTDTNHAVKAVQKTIDVNGVPQVSWRFVDGLGREVYFRGFNVSGATKLSEIGFKPFKNLDDAQRTFSTMRATTGANVIRFLIAWEGVHPGPDQINYAYLDDVIKQMKVAVDNHIYVLLDYHQDLFSRHLFDTKSRYVGNGAPAWVVPKSEYPMERCFLCITWSQNNLTNPAVRAAFRNFWNNASFPSSNGERYMQDEFLWQLGKSLQYISEHLDPEDFAYIVGLDPFNEPVDGGKEGLDDAQWDQQKLWPFHQRVRAVMNSAGWKEKLLFAEPLVYWNVNIVIVPSTGGHHVQMPPDEGYVFNSHFYDTSRMGVNPMQVNNGQYVKIFNEIRDEADYIQGPSFVSEFGMDIAENKRQDPHTMIHAMYQSMEASTSSEDKTRQAFYAPFISSTQWHWDMYHDQHHELMNGNSNRIIEKGDAWNDETFSVVTNGGDKYTIDKRLIERVYPRRVQGDLMNFYYNDLASDREQNQYQWAAISHPGSDSKIYANNRFALLTWRDGNGEAPTEIFIPASLDYKNIIIITEQFAVPASQLMDEQALEKYHAILTADMPGGGYRLILWPSSDSKGNLRFAFILGDDDFSTPSSMSEAQEQFVNSIIRLQMNPVVFYDKGLLGTAKD